MILTGTTTSGQNGRGSNGKKGTLYSPKLQDWSLTIRLFSVITMIFVMGGCLSPQQRCIQSILHPQLTEQHCHCNNKKGCGT